MRCPLNTGTPVYYKGMCHSQINLLLYYYEMPFEHRYSCILQDNVPFTNKYFTILLWDALWTQVLLYTTRQCAIYKYIFYYTTMRCPLNAGTPVYYKAMCHSQINLWMAHCHSQKSANLLYHICLYYYEKHFQAGYQCILPDMSPVTK